MKTTRQLNTNKHIYRLIGQVLILSAFVTQYTLVSKWETQIREKEGALSRLEWSQDRSLHFLNLYFTTLGDPNLDNSAFIRKAALEYGNGQLQIIESLDLDEEARARQLVEMSSRSLLVTDLDSYNEFIMFTNRTEPAKAENYLSSISQINRFIAISGNIYIVLYLLGGISMISGIYYEFKKESNVV